MIKKPDVERASAKPELLFCLTALKQVGGWMWSQRRVPAIFQVEVMWCKIASGFMHHVRTIPGRRWLQAENTEPDRNILTKTKGTDEKCGQSMQLSTATTKVWSSLKMRFPSRSTLTSQHMESKNQTSEENAPQVRESRCCWMIDWLQHFKPLVSEKWQRGTNQRIRGAEVEDQPNCLEQATNPRSRLL